jgi:hypothetical protein
MEKTMTDDPLESQQIELNPPTAYVLIELLDSALQSEEHRKNHTNSR